jgi:tetratricopeptide (TPR) repeat protein
MKWTSLGVYLLATIAAPCVGLPQAVTESAADRERQIIAAIEQEQSRNGPNAEQLIAPLTDLALLYQESGDHASAAAAIQQIRQLVRVNYGLHSLEQAPMIQRLIAYEAATGNAETAWELDQELVSLARRHPNDLRTVSIFRELADLRMKRWSTGELTARTVCSTAPARARAPTPFELGDFVATPEPVGPDCSAPGYTGAYEIVRRETLKNYAEAIDVLRRNELYSSPELRELEMELVRSGNCDIAKESYRRLVSYNAANSEPWLERARTFVEAADLELRCSDADVALDMYEQSYALLKQKGVTQASIDEIFSPEVPVVLSTFLPNPLPTKQTAGRQGYIDLRFDITQRGEARSIEVLDATAGTAAAYKDRLVELIADSLFRPRVANGHLARRAPVSIRYYVNE